MSKVVHFSKYLLVTAGLYGSTSLASTNPSVQLVETLTGGNQPKVAVDPRQGTHLIFYKGDPRGGNLFYSRQAKGGDFSSPIQVNSLGGSAVSMGTIRGAQFAIGKDESVHVVWNGATQSGQRHSHPPMYYARLLRSEDQFSSQRGISGKWLVDGGGAVAANQQGDVMLFWHSSLPGQSEDRRRVYMRVSHDNGVNFDEPRAISPQGRGVCSCCAMQATVDQHGNIYVLYRAAEENINRDIDLLVSQDGGKTFTHAVMDRWRLDACPMSSMALCEQDESMLVAWETDGRIRLTSLTKGSTQAGPIMSPPGGARSAKHPVFATTRQGGFLLAWTEGTGWAKGGAVAWQAYGDEMKPLSSVHRLPAGIEVWSFAAAYFDQDQMVYRLLH